MKRTIEIPSWVLTDFGPIVGPHGLAVYLALEWGGDQPPSQPQIARMTGMSERQVRREIALLAEVGLVDRGLDGSAFPSTGGPELPPGEAAARPSGRDAIRASVWAKTGGRCFYCQHPLNPFLDFTIDHVVPVAKGGGDELANLVPACRLCNSRKGAS